MEKESYEDGGGTSLLGDKHPDGIVCFSKLHCLFKKKKKHVLFISIHLAGSFNVYPPKKGEKYKKSLSISRNVMSYGEPITNSLIRLPHTIPTYVNSITNQTSLVP
jgi:hypothetical protein